MPELVDHSNPTRDDPTRLTTTTMVVAGLLAGTPALATGAWLIQDPFGRGLLNPDSAMRLVRLQDILAAHAPLHAVMRDSSGEGSILHWSHLLDSLLLLLAAPFTLLMSWPDALHLVGLAFGPLSLAALGIAVAWAASPVAARTGGQGWLLLGAFATGASVSVHGYGMMGVVHHHTLLVFVTVISAGWALRILRGGDPVCGGIGMGAAASAGLWLSPESLLFSLMAVGAVGIAWLASPALQRRGLATALVTAGTTLAFITSLAWLVDPPEAGLFAVEIDRLSLPFVLIGLGAAIVGATAAATGHRTATVATAAALSGAWLAAFPQLLRGTSGLMSSDAAAALLGPITEMQPIHGMDAVLSYLTGGLFAAGTLATFAWRLRATTAVAVLTYAVICVLGALALAVSHLRFAAYPCVAGAALLPIVLAAITASSASAKLQVLCRVGTAVGMLTLPILAPLTATAAQPRQHAPTSCPLAGAVALLASHPGEIVLADVNQTPDILYRTQARTVGSLYHRNPDGFMRLRAAWRVIPTGDAPPPELILTGATLVLGCPGAARSALLDGLPSTTLLDRLAANNPPAWLERIADAGPGGYVLYGVRR